MKFPFTVLFLIVSEALYGMWIVSDMRKDIEFVKVQLVEQHGRDDKQDKTATESLTLVRSQLDRIEEKLYRIAEQRGVK